MSIPWEKDAQACLYCDKSLPVISTLSKCQVVREYTPSRQGIHAVIKNHKSPPGQNTSVDFSECEAKDQR